MELFKLQNVGVINIILTFSPFVRNEGIQITGILEPLILD